MQQMNKKRIKDNLKKWRIIFLVVSITLILAVTTSSYSINNTDNLEFRNDNVILDSLIQWSPDNLLKWEYYQGEPDTIRFKDFKAVTYAWYKHENYNVFKDSIVFDLVSYFVVNASWVTEKSDELLAHEQTHFNLYEVFTRKIRKELGKYRYDNENDFVNYYSSIINIDANKRKDFQNLYDKETDYGRNHEAQEKWNQKVNEMLKELEDYSNTRVVIKRRAIPETKANK